MKTYEQFKDALTENLKQKFGEEAKVTVYTVAKTNHTEEQITVQSPETRVAPSVSLHSLYAEYQRCGNVDDVADSLVGLFESTQEGFKMPMLTVEEARENIFYQLVSSEKNEALLKECIHREVPNTDLVLILRWKCGEDATFIVKRGLAEHLKLSEEELFKFADDNLATEPYSFQSMNKVIAGMLGIDSEDVPDIDLGLNVLTNSTKQYGAAMLFKQEAKEAVGEKLGFPFYILPSSTHEVLVLPDDGDMDPKELLAMVQEVNQTEVAAEDVLSDHIYRCDLHGGIQMVM